MSNIMIICFWKSNNSVWW